MISLITSCPNYDSSKNKFWNFHKDLLVIGEEL